MSDVKWYWPVDRADGDLVEKGNPSHVITCPIEGVVLASSYAFAVDRITALEHEVEQLTLSIESAPNHTRDALARVKGLEDGLKRHLTTLEYWAGNSNYVDDDVVDAIAGLNSLLPPTPAPEEGE